MAANDSYKRHFLMLLICLLVGWNYWIPLIMQQPREHSEVPWAVYGLDSSDFHIFYSAGRALLMHGNPYSHDGKPTGFVYPPTSLPFFAAFTLFDVGVAAQLWAITYFSLFAVALVALAITLKGEKRYVYLPIAILLFLTSYPVFINFQLGQSDLLVTSLAILSLVCERLKHESASALILSVATVLKGPAVLLLVYFVFFRRNFLYLVRYVAFTVLIVAASLLVVPIGVYWYYVVNVIPTLSGAFALQSNQSIVGVMSLAGLRKFTPLVSAAAFVLFGIFSFYVGSRTLGDMSDEWWLRADSMFVMNVLVMLLFGSRSTVYPYVWVILPLALFLSSLLMHHVKFPYLMLVCLATFLLNSALSPNFLDYRTFPLAVIGNLVLTVSLVAFYICPTAIISNNPLN